MAGGIQPMSAGVAPIYGRTGPRRPRELRSHHLEDFVEGCRGACRADGGRAVASSGPVFPAALPRGRSPKKSQNITVTKPDGLRNPGWST